MANDPSLVSSYLALEKIALAKMDDAEKVQWFQQRAISAEAAAAQLELEKQVGDVIKDFPAVEPEDVKGLKTVEEIRSVAQRIQAKADKFQAQGQKTVEETVKEALKLKDEDIAEMQKAYGKPRQSTAGDVTGSGIQATTAAANAGIGNGDDEKIELGTMDAVTKTAMRTARRFGIIE